MKSTINYLDEAKGKLGIESDYGMAKWLGVGRAAVSNWRVRRNFIDDYAAAKIADALGIDPMIVIAAANAEREKDAEKRGYWEKYYQRLGGLAAGLFLAVNLIMTPTPSQAAPVLETGVPFCILCKIIERYKMAFKEIALFAIYQVSRLCKAIMRISQMPA